jgi:hypothetical protein
MRLLPFIAAASIGLFATAAVAQNMNTADPNSAPGASATGGKPSGPVNRANTADPNSAPGASSTGGRPSRAIGSQNMDTVQKGNPNRPSAGQTVGMGKSAHKMKKNKTKKMQKAPVQKDM